MRHNTIRVAATIVAVGALHTAPAKTVDCGPQPIPPSFSKQIVPVGLTLSCLGTFVTTVFPNQRGTLTD
jgi:hypothetical protein